LAAKPDDRVNLHATCIVLHGRAALIRGASGSGKSDLALRCIGLVPAAPWPGPALLVSDDQVIVTREGSRLMARPPPRLAGLIEVRGIGIVPVPYAGWGEVALLVDLDRGAVERLPDPMPLEEVLGIALPVLRLSPFEASAPLKLLSVLSRAGVASAP
jgi:serine kinase of HPr protein (carbohydrate metabolism regulator)